MVLSYESGAAEDAKLVAGLVDRLNGADPDACNYKKQTALVFARTLGMRAIEQILARAS